MKKIVLLSLFLLTPLAANATMYKCTKSDGSVAFQDKPCATGKEETVDYKAKDPQAIQVKRRSADDGKPVKLSQKALQGQWVLEGAEEFGDYWEFRGNMFTPYNAGKSMGSDPYTIKGNRIDLDYYDFEVTSITSNQMKTSIGTYNRK